MFFNELYFNFRPEWYGGGPPTPERCIWCKHDPPETPKDIPAVGVGGPAGRNPYHLASGRLGIPGSLLLRVNAR